MGSESSLKREKKHDFFIKILKFRSVYSICNLCFELDYITIIAGARKVFVFIFALTNFSFLGRGCPDENEISLERCEQQARILHSTAMVN